MGLRFDSSLVWYMNKRRLPEGSSPSSSTRTMIESHLKAIDVELKKAFKLLDPSQQGTAPMLVRLMNIEREVYFINFFLNRKENE